MPDDYNFQGYGAHEFPYYCNGGIFPLDTVAAIMAFRRAGMKDRAEIIRKQIFRRQHEGILPHGSGFYMGVVNEPGQCYSILKWDGTPTDYEGIISRDCSFLQTVILSDDPARALFDEAADNPLPQIPDKHSDDRPRHTDTETSPTMKHQTIRSICCRVILRHTMKARHQLCQSALESVPGVLRLQEYMDTSQIVREAPTVHSGDDWEVFVARRNSLGEPYRQIAVDAQGKSADFSYNVTDQGLIQEAGARVYSDTSAADCWTVFLAIPLDRLLPGRAVTKPNESVAINVVRATLGSAETAAMWIPTMTASFHELDRLGRIALLPAGVRHENRIQQPGFEEVLPLKETEDWQSTTEAYWLKEARARKLDEGAEWCMAWIPNVLPEVCEGESLRIVKGEAGKEVHGGTHALQIKGGKHGFHIYQSETGQGPDGTYRCRFFGRGTGKLTLATYEYSNKPGSGCPANHGAIGTFELGPEWREFAGTYKPSAKSDAKFSFVLAVPPGTVATLDDLEFWKE